MALFATSFFWDEECQLVYFGATKFCYFGGLAVFTGCGREDVFMTGIDYFFPCGIWNSVIQCILVMSTLLWSQKLKNSKYYGFWINYHFINENQSFPLETGRNNFFCIFPFGGFSYIWPIFSHGPSDRIHFRENWNLFITLNVEISDHKVPIWESPLSNEVENCQSSLFRLSFKKCFLWNLFVYPCECQIRILWKFFLDKFALKILVKKSKKRLCLGQIPEEKSTQKTPVYFYFL